MEEKDIKRMPFGKRIKVGNFLVTKYVKTMSGKEIKAMRNTMGIPSDIQKSLMRSGLPYIKIEAVSGIWSAEYCCNTAVFTMIDRCLTTALAIVGDEKQKEGYDGPLVSDFANLFNHWFTDCTIVFDQEYYQKKTVLLKEYWERISAKREVSDEEDKEALDDVKSDDDAQATIKDMAEGIKNDE